MKGVAAYVAGLFRDISRKYRESKLVSERHTVPVANIVGPMVRRFGVKVNEVVVLCFTMNIDKSV